MLSLEQIRNRLERKCIARAAKGSGLHYNTVYRIAKGITENPGIASIAALSDWLVVGDGRFSGDVGNTSEAASDLDAQS